MTESHDRDIDTVLGYHGTHKQAASLIVQHGFKISNNDFDWLGDGVYFWEGAPKRAREWAIQCFGEEATVIGARIRILDFIDLLDIPWASVVADAHDAYVSLCRQENRELPRQTSGAHRLDREILNYLIGTLGDQGVLVRGVRGAFAEGRRLFPRSALFDRSHVQIAVRDLSVIEEIWEISEEERFKNVGP